MRPRIPHSVALPRPPISLPRRRRTRPSTSDIAHNGRIMPRDSVAMGVINASSTFLPVLIARLGGTAFHIGLLTAIPAVAGFTLAIPIGQYLQRKSNVVAWYSGARFVASMSYSAIAIAVVLAPRDIVIPLIMTIWAIAAIPSTIGMVLFPIVMDGAAGPHGRMELMSLRWSVVGLTMAIVTTVIGQFLDRFPFPVNYAIVFAAFSLAGVASFYYARQFRIPRVEPPALVAGRRSPRVRFRDGIALLRSYPAFLGYSIRQIVYISGNRMVLPLIPLYYVTVVDAPDAWIGIIATGQALALLGGYQVFRRISRRRGTRLLLILALTVSSIFPIALSLTDQLVLVAVLATVAGFFAAGVDLILFDELMRAIPRQYGVTFTSIDTTLVNLATIIAPLIGAALVGLVSIEFALRVGAAISLVGVVLFAREARRNRSAAGPVDPAAGTPPEPPAPADPPIVVAPLDPASSSTIGGAETAGTETEIA